MTKTECSSKELPTLSPGLKRALSKVSLPYYAEESINLETGLKFSFRDHEYLFDIFNDNSDNLVIQKATQMGLTTFAFIKSLWGCMNLFPLGVIYFFPTQRDVFDFSTARINPFLNYNRHLKILDAQGVDNVGLKKVGKSYIYFRGMKSTLAMKSVPADCVVFDEIDEADPSAKEIALKRIDHSDFKWIIELSNPTIENYGINRSFQETDQKYFYFKCPHCGAWESFDKTFPDCLQEQKDGTIVRICTKCKKELPLDSKAEWIADYPTRFERRGYYVSQLYSRYISPAKIFSEYKTKKGFELESFYRLRLGRAYTIAENRLTKAQVINLISKESIEMPKDTYCFLGVDQGKDLHCTITCEKGGKTFIKKTLILTDFEQLDKVIKEENIICCVIDALPETRKAKEFQKRNQGIVYLNFYVDTVKGGYKWDDIQGIVQENRTESLDFSHDLLTSDKLILYNDLVNASEFAEHCSNIVRQVKEDEATGSKKFEWIKTGADHFRHSFNYACIAKSRLGNQQRIL